MNATGKSVVSRSSACKEGNDPYLMLPFVAPQQKGKPRNFWSPQRTGCAFHDELLGQAMAWRLIDHMRAENESSLLGLVIGDMLKAGVAFDHLELSFLNTIAKAAIRGGSR